MRMRNGQCVSSSNIDASLFLEHLPGLEWTAVVADMSAGVL